MFGKGGLAGFGSRGGVLAALLLAFCGAAAAAPDTDEQHVLDGLKLKSNAVLVVDQDTGETLADKNADVVLPIASLTKLMTALVVLDSGLPGDSVLEITSDDVDREKHTPSRLAVGTRLSRDELLLLALMASENRAAMALSRHYPDGRAAFVARMNARAQVLGMRDTHFADPAGLSNSSVSTARDLQKLVAAAYEQPLIRDYTTRHDYTVRVGKRLWKFGNSNRLVRAKSWNIGLQKTGFTNEAGRCLVLQARVANRRLAMIFLDSFGKLTRYGDARRVRQGLERVDRKGRNAATMTSGAP
jgi:D-alanyl-D-alanine endopeptidase (penicillin-binding protein 7)